MNLKIDTSINEKYTSPSQRARLLTEKWTYNNVLCPGCGGSLEKYPNNRPVADFQCRICSEDFELKATSSCIGKSIPDGAYSTMLRRLTSKENPNLFLLHYSPTEWFVSNLLVVPRHYFNPSIIQSRPPLAATARRAGWIGCNILVGEIPAAGRISLVVDRVALSVKSVVAAWKKTRFLSEIPSGRSKSWLLKTMLCIDRLGKKRFELKEIYAFEAELREAFPENRHIRDKLRQQLQVLRDEGYLKFLGDGRYELQTLKVSETISLAG